MKNQKGVSMITLIITIIVIIILAAIAFVGMDDATGGAQFSGFAQEFGDYALNFKADSVGDLREKYGVDGITKTDAQLYYEAATGTAAGAGVLVPAGEVFAALANPASGNAVLMGGNADMFANDAKCYKIKDSNVTGYEDNHKFYGDNLGTEEHYVTEKGVVFTIPGFPRTVDEEYRMYINADTYYVSNAAHDDLATKTAHETGDAEEAVVLDQTTTPATPTPNPAG